MRSWWTLVAVGWANTILINENTSRLEIQQLFPCGSITAIGAYNEYFQTCRLQPNVSSMILQNRHIVAQRDLDISPGILHVEVDIQLTQNLTLKQASLVASAINVLSAGISMDINSSISASALGLKYGPGYSSWLAMGSSYGGNGGIALTPSAPICTLQSPEMSLRPIGNIEANNEATRRAFRGYGSGGGSEMVRGGGRLNLTSTEFIIMDGILESNGGSSTEGTGSAGSGGTILLKTTALSGKGRIHARGGNAAVLQDSLLDFGGGGAGGGGRIVLVYNLSTLDVSAVDALGGKPSNYSDAARCQAGAAGTVVLRDPIHGQLLIRDAHMENGINSGALKLSSTLLLFDKSMDTAIPPWLTKVTISEHARIIASNIMLEVRQDQSMLTVTQQSYNSVLTEFTMEKQCLLQPLPNMDTIQITAGTVTIAGQITRHGMNGNDPNIVERMEFHAFGVIVQGGDLTASNIVLVCSHEAKVDASSVFKVQNLLEIRSLDAVDLQGFVSAAGPQPANISIFSIGKATVALQPTQSELLDLNVLAGKELSISIPSQSPFASITISGSNVFVSGSNSGTTKNTCMAHQTENQLCPPLKQMQVADFLKYKEDSEYHIKVFASESVQLSNITTASLLVCGPSIKVSGTVSSQGKGCKVGPGHSSTGGTMASGGAGHGGKGGAVITSDKQHVQATSGRSYDASPYPHWPGSGAAGTPEGGSAGGGVIYLKTNTLVFDPGSIVSVAGSNGIGRSGGGSGGTIVLWINQSISGAGTIEVNGGNAGNEVQLGTSAFGGGGSGGRIRVMLGNVSGESFFRGGGKLNLKGGTSQGGEDGEDGRNSPSICPVGYGNAFCLPCEPGTYSPNTTAPCLPCPEGTFSSNATSSTCQACEKGSIANHQKSVNCTLCPIGFSTFSIRSKRCYACHIKPPHSTFSEAGSCAYKCDAGRVGLNCLTPFERLVAPIGGPVGFILLSLVLMTAIFGIWGLASRRKVPKEIEDWFEVNVPIVDGNSKYEKWKRDVDMEEHWRQKAFAPRLSGKDLQGHLSRIYFQGHNVWASPWILDRKPAAELEQFVYSGSYSAFVEHCNAIISWSVEASRWEWNCYQTLRYTCPPICYYYVSWRQLVRIRKLSSYILEFQGKFFRDLDLRMYQIKLKLGVSPCNCLGYVDVIYTGSQESETTAGLLSTLTGSKTMFPMDLIIAGRGTFLCPYYLDTNDLYLRSVPSNISILADDVWVEFVAAFNKSIRKWNMEKLSKTLLELVELIVQFNDRDELDGLLIQLGKQESSIFEAYHDANGVIVDSERKRNEIICLRISRNIMSPSPKNQGQQWDQNSSDTSPTTLSTSRIRLEELYGNSSPEISADEGTNPILEPLIQQSKEKKSRNWFMEYITLRNSVSMDDSIIPKKRRPLWLLVLLLMDIMTTFLFLTEIACIQFADPITSPCSPLVFVLVVLIIPFAPMMGPGTGLVFLFRHVGIIGRIYAQWNLLSTGSILVGWILVLASINTVGRWPLIYSTVLILLKHLQKTEIVRCVIQFEDERPLAGWRGLHTTTEYYDATTNPNVCQLEY